MFFWFSEASWVEIYGWLVYGPISYLHVNTVVFVCHFQCKPDIWSTKHQKWNACCIYFQYLQDRHSVFYCLAVVTVRQMEWCSLGSLRVSCGAAVTFVLYSCGGSSEGCSDLLVLEKRLSFVCYNWIPLQFKGLFMEYSLTVIVIQKTHNARLRMSLSCGGRITLLIGRVQTCYMSLRYILA